MARRKGVSKTKNSHGRKITSETSHPPREDDRLKNDPGGTSPHDMDETRLISSKKVQNYKINNIRNNDDNQSNRQSPVDPVTHRQDSSKLNSSEKDTIDAIRSEQHNSKSSQELINSKNSNNNNTSKTIINNSSNDLKYLHKKFKRIASATFEDEVQNHRQSIENIVVDDNRDKSASKSISSKDNITSINSNNCTNKDQNQYKLVNGNAQPQVQVSISTDGIKGVFLTPEINGDYIERQRTYSPHIRVKSANELKYSPKPEENFVNNLLIKPERISPQTNTNHNNNNILNRVPLIPSNLRTSSPSKTVANVGNNQKVQQQQQQQQQQQHQQPQRSQQREVDQSFSGRHVCPYCNLNCTKPSVLQKHIRAHTNERPYPCDTCGFAFKTKSNYYKHCRSRSHALRMKGGDPQPDDDGSLGSDQDQDPDLSNSSSDVISRTASPMDERTSSPAVQQQAAQSFLKYSNEKPYKPKFHNAALYAKEETTQQKQQHNNHNLNNHFNSTISNYYSSSSHHYHQQHQQQQQQHQQPQQQQSNELDSSIHFQQAGKNRSEQAPQISQTFQQVAASAYPESSSQNRESTSSTFGGLTSTSTAGAHPLNRQRFAEHISKIISQNEAIVESKELLLQKKYPKVGAKAKMIMSSENSTSRVAFALSAKQQQQQQQQQQHTQQQQRDETSASKATPLQQNTSITTNGLPNVSAASQKLTQQIVANSGQPPETTLSSQPLNLSKINEQAENTRKRPSTESFNVAILEGSTPPQPIKNLSSHPQNPERSIIKHLLLNARGLGVPNGEGDDAVYSCPLCNLEFRSAEDLRLHTSNYCQGGPSSAPISPVASPSYKYFRSNSINVNLPEFNNPNSLAKLARSSLLHLSRNPLSLAKLAWSQLKTKPSNLVLNQLNVNTNTAAGSSSSQASTESSSSLQKLIDAPLPSPGPLLGKTPLVEAYNNTERKSEDVIITKVHEENRNFTKELSPKRLRLNNYPHQSYQSLGNENNPSSIANSLNVFPNTSLLDPPSNKPHQNYIMCGGEVQMLNKKEDRMKRFLSSGGCVIPISECPDLEASPKMIRTPLLSGGSFTEVSPKSGNRDMPLTPSSTPKMMIPIAPLTPSLPAPNLLNAGLPLPNHFQFPPINSITAFNPLTLPPVSIVPSSVMHGDKLIPFVPGIPGPNSLAPPPLTHPPQRLGDLVLSRNVSPSRKKTPSPLVQNSMLGPTDAGIQRVSHNQSPRQIPKLCVRVEGETPPQVELVRPTQRSPRAWTPQSSPAVETVKKTFNFTRMADNLSPRKSTVEKPARSPEREREVRHFNFENIPKVDIVAPPSSSTQIQQQPLMPLHVDVSNTTSKTSKEPSETEIAEARSKAKSKFLRPTSLPLKPGTFTPKRHHGITPTANTLPLISPETPRPSKACIQLYLNGHAYTYLGLKCSTKMFYCTVNCPQPSYVANLHKLSMYSVWQVCAENNPHPLGLKPKTVMALYDSRQRSSTFLMASIKSECSTVHSQPTVMTPFENNAGQFYHHQVKSIQSSSECSGKNGDPNSKSSNSNNVLVGGYESNEDYTYIRGRGRGKYVCSECGIRCKKPSMLKKHIRTHTDVRPYTCQHCSFSFKTKGNLTKHMQSKTHYKKCLELGISPGPIPMDGDFMETEIDMDRQSTISGGGRTSSVPEESDSEDYSDGGDGETESSDTDESKSRLPEHEAARCLLSLSMTPPSAALSQMGHGRSHYGGYHQQTIPDYGSSNPASDNQGLLQPYSSRRVISFTSPKPPFDYQKQEQYYSNPSIIPKGKEDKFDESSMKPIDLTKPRQFDQNRVTDVIGDLASETGLLKSLVFNTDKIRTSVPAPVQAKNLDENILLQAYLTEQALQYSKIKQSQMNKTFPEITTNSSTTSLTTSTVFSTINDRSYERSSFIRHDHNNSTYSTVGTRAFSAVSSAVLSQPVTSVQEQSSITLEKSISDPASTSAVLDHRIEQSQSPFQHQADAKTDAENKSPSRVNPSLFHSTQSQETTSKETNTPRPKVAVPGPGNAKSVASEYLKMTSAEYMKSRNSKNDESEESSSDQEINTAENAGSGLKPPSDFSGILARTVIVGEDGFKNSANEVQPMFSRVPISDDGRPVCTICSKTFQKQHQMVLHMNIHYMERKFKCEPCAVSFRTQGHLQKHERSEAHKNKVMMTSTFGVPTTSNPRPFECSDCKVAFRIHGHLAKHLRSKTHVQKLECLQKLPFGTYAEIERAGISLTEIDTTDCDNSLASLKVLAQKLIDKDPSKLGSYTTPSCMETNSSGVMSHESGSEDSPEAQAEVHESARELQNDPGSFASSSEGSGVKRKFDSFSSCSNDSLPNMSQPDMAHAEKRPRTTSET